MEGKLSSRLAPKYYGNLVYSSSRKVIHSEIEVASLTDLLVKVRFELEGQEYVFRSVLSHQEDGILMVIQNRVTKSYMLSGISGFLHHKPSIHGGFVPRLNSFYFHVKIAFFEGTHNEVFFLGREKDSYLQLRGERHKYLSA